MAKSNTSLERWNIEKAVDLYGIKSWSAGYFDISKKGEVVITPCKGNGSVSVSMTEIIDGLSERGLDMPVLLRIQNILHSQISRLYESFQTAIELLNYQGSFKGVFPIKVNQQEQVISEIAQFGSKYHHGFEAGSKPELIAALSLLQDRESCIICNGYKDEEFIDLGLYACKMGYQCFFVLESPSELEMILERSEELGVEPLLGARVKLATKAGGHWSDSGGDRSIFGLNTTQLVEAVDYLKEKGKINCLKLLHYHLGSQIPNIRDIRAAVMEATRIYSGLITEGAPMGFLDLGGGLAVDYDGSHTNFSSSRNYSLEEYCADVIESVVELLEGTDIPHPTIVTESGRETVAYYSVLLFNILEVSKFEALPLPDRLPEDSPDLILNLHEALTNVSVKNLQECFNDALFYRDELRQHFKLGEINLRQRSLGEKIFWNIIHRVAGLLDELKFIPHDLEDIEIALADIYYGNFSIFQSLPDSWAINHLFPIMPIHRLQEEPTCQAVIADITCDCDGKIDRFIDQRGVKESILLHPLKDKEEYYLGVFLVGAYQETLGDLHNLFGDTNVVSIMITEDGNYEFTRELEGDSVADVLSYVEYDPKQLRSLFREQAERAIREGRISGKERKKIMSAFDAGLRGYTYFER
jgi:arginine decarboxylase